MTSKRYLPVHLPEFETAEAPAPDHAGNPQHVPVFSAFGTALRLGLILSRGSMAPGDCDVIFAAKRLIEDGYKRGVL